jgi:hypothetical protein
VSVDLVVTLFSLSVMTLSHLHRIYSAEWENEWECGKYGKGSGRGLFLDTDVAVTGMSF